LRGVDSKYLFVHHKSHTDNSETEPCHPRYKAGDKRLSQRLSTTCHYARHEGIWRSERHLHSSHNRRIM